MRRITIPLAFLLIPLVFAGYGKENSSENNNKPKAALAIPADERSGLQVAGLKLKPEPVKSFIGSNAGN